MVIDGGEALTLGNPVLN